MRNRYDAFWFPPSIRNEIITAETEYETLHFRGGAPVAESKGDDVVSVRWPRLDLAQWQWLVGALRRNQNQVYMHRWAERLPQALRQMRNLWADPNDPLRQSVLAGLESCTGHPVRMLDFALSLFDDLLSVEELQRAAACRLPHAVRAEFISPDGLTGRVRFFEENRAGRLLLRLESYRRRPWPMRPAPLDLMLGFAAGNVPGAGLLFILLGLAAVRDPESGPPIIIVKNSRREPIFTPLVLSALELVDPALLSTTVVTIWDYTDPVLQGYLIGQADLVIAAASDETIAQIGRTVDLVSAQVRPVRFHRHGHRVSFSTIGRECLAPDRIEPRSGAPLLPVVARLAALDVALWDQQSSLSSRVHFVETEDEEALDAYAQALAHSLRLLGRQMPKSQSHRRQIHNLFDQYQALTGGGQVRLFSEYDDDFLVALDRRDLDGDRFWQVVNGCRGRSVVIIPVADVLDVPRRYLSRLPADLLQTMGVALGDPDSDDLPPRLLHYAEALGRVGICSIRTLGRGAFPQLAYSWDGYLPLDLTVERRRGRFTALEFDQPWAQMAETYRLAAQALDVD